MNLNTVEQINNTPCLPAKFQNIRMRIQQLWKAGMYLGVKIWIPI